MAIRKNLEAVATYMTAARNEVSTARDRAFWNCPDCDEWANTSYWYDEAAKDLAEAQRLIERAAAHLARI